MKYLVVASLVFSIGAMGVATACSSSDGSSAPTADPGTPTDPESGDDASVEASKKPTPDAADSGPAYEQITVGSSSAGQTCDQICKTAGDTCTPTCEFGNSTAAGKIAGQVTYSHTSTGSSSGSSFTDYDYIALKTCSDVVAASEKQFGDTYQLSFDFGEPIQCCCLGRKHTPVEGNVQALASCNDVCKAKGLTCDPDPAHGGGRTDYQCSDLTGLQHPIGCDEVPVKDRRSGSATCGLESYSCRCW